MQRWVFRPWTSPHIGLVERTRAGIRSLVGEFLLGDVWDRIATVPATRST